MKKSKSLVCLITSMLIMGNLMTGCNSSKTASGDMKTDGKVKVSIWWAQDEQFKAPLLEAINSYQKDHPNVEIVPEWKPNFDYYEDYKVSLVGKQAPDIVKIDHVNVQALGHKNQIVNMSELGADKLADKFVESTWKANEYKGKIYALPFDANTIAFMYNKDLLDKTGKKVPTNYDEVVDTAKAVTDLGQKGVFGYTVPVDPGSSGWLTFQWYSWLWRCGGEILNEDWTKVKFNSAEGVEALQKVVDLSNKYKAIPPTSYMENEFYTGKIGLLDMGCWNVPRITGKDAPAKFGVAKLPVLKQGIPAYSGLGVYSLAVTKESKSQKEAYEFAKYLATNKELQFQYAKKTNLIPSLKEAQSNEFFNTPEWKVYFEQLKIAKSRPGTPAWPEIDKYVNAAIQEALTKAKTPKQALDDAAAKCNEVLKNIK